MVDLEKERKAFEELSSKNGVRNFSRSGMDDGYSSADLDYNWHIWVKSAESKQAEIDSLKAENEELKTAYSGTNAALLDQLKLNSDLHEKLLGVSDGEFVVVPREPTDNMIDAANEFVSEDYSDMEAAYKAMIEAAQGDGDE